MTKTMLAALALVALGAFVLGAYAGGASMWDLDYARAALRIEMQVDKAGNPTEIEFHVDPATLPAAVRAAMDRLHPGGPYTDAEIEYDDGVAYYELNRDVGGFEVEAMFAADGTLHSEEITVPADKVPAAVKAAVATGWPQGQVTGYEEIRDGDRTLVEYHVKLVEGGRKYKVLLGVDGSHLGAFLEVPAEVEVPAPPR